MFPLFSFLLLPKSILNYIYFLFSPVNFGNFTQILKNTRCLLTFLLIYSKINPVLRCFWRKYEKKLSFYWKNWVFRERERFETCGVHGENRTRNICLEGRSFTIKLHIHTRGWFDFAGFTTKSLPMPSVFEKRYSRVWGQTSLLRRFWFSINPYFITAFVLIFGGFITQGLHLNPEQPLIFIVRRVLRLIVKPHKEDVAPLGHALLSHLIFILLTQNERAFWALWDSNPYFQILVLYHYTKDSYWKRVWDSNPRKFSRPNSFQDCLNKPDSDNSPYRWSSRPIPTRLFDHCYYIYNNPTAKVPSNNDS